MAETRIEAIIPLAKHLLEVDPVESRRATKWVVEVFLDTGANLRSFHMYEKRCSARIHDIHLSSE